jgi:hypothetical protein
MPNPKGQAMRMLAIVACMALCEGCRSAPSPPPGTNFQTARQLPTATLEQILAPVALYPDSLLAQMLMCATDAPKVAELDQWLKDNQRLKGTRLQDAAVKAGFDPSFVALTLFPSIVAKMAEQIAWTLALGQAFTSDKTAVFATIQKLRHQASDVGSLKTTPQQKVEKKKTSKGEEVIVIEPANPQVIYVPQYNTQVIYTAPPPAPAPAPVTTTAAAPSSTTVIIQEEDNDAEVALAAGIIGFTAGIAIGAAMDNHYYHGPYGWHGGGYMYADAWDDYYDAREDAREDWMDHREDLAEERTERFEDRGEQRTERQANNQEQRTERRTANQEQRTERQTGNQAQRDERQQSRQDGRPAQGERADRVSQPAAGDRVSQPGAADRVSQPGAGDRVSQPGAADRVSQPGAGDRVSQSGAADRVSQPQAGDRASQSQGALGQDGRTDRAGSMESRGYGDGGRSPSVSQPSAATSGRSDAFSGYSSGSSQRAASSRGQSSRSSSARSSGGSARSSGGGSRRR